MWPKGVGLDFGAKAPQGLQCLSQYMWSKHPTPHHSWISTYLNPNEGLTHQLGSALFLAKGARRRICFEPMIEKNGRGRATWLVTSRTSPRFHNCYCKPIQLEAGLPFVKKLKLKSATIRSWAGVWSLGSSFHRSPTARHPVLEALGIPRQAPRPASLQRPPEETCTVEGRCISRSQDHPRMAAGDWSEKW